MEEYNHISLFSGIGGFDLAADWMGWNNVAHCEWNTFAQRILKYYWPNAISYEDITKTDFSIHRGTIDIVTGGFPCQPYSTAGKRKGKDDERHLWPEMLRAISEIQPSWVVGENVSGLTNWNGGLVFEEVQADLENQGYKILPFLLPAASVQAPHIRERVWFIAYSDSYSKRSSRESGEIESNRCQNNLQSKSRRTETEFNIGCGDVLQSITNSESIGGRERIREEVNNIGRWKSGEYIAKGNEVRFRGETIGRTGISCDTNGSRSKEFDLSKKSTEQGFSDRECYENGGYWDNFPTQSPIYDGNDGLSSRLDGITLSKFRKESIKAGGNAIVPQLALQIFRAIEKYNNLKL